MFEKTGSAKYVYQSEAHLILTQKRKMSGQTNTKMGKTFALLVSIMINEMALGNHKVLRLGFKWNTWMYYM